MDALEIDLSQKPSDCLSLSLHLLTGQVINMCCERDLTFIGEIKLWYM